MGDIGPNRRGIEFQPMPETAPIQEPAPAQAPATPERVEQPA